MPDCTQPIYIGTDYFGEIAHVYPVGGSGEARYDSAIPEEFIHSYENLLLICRNCHARVDNTPSRYSAEDLFAIKRAHEEGTTPLSSAAGLEEIIAEAFERNDARIAAILTENQRLNEQIGQLRDDLRRQMTLQASIGPIKESARYRPFNKSTSIKELRDKGQHRAIMTILQKEKEAYWQELPDLERYLLQRDLAMIAVDLNEFAIAIPLLKELPGLAGAEKGAAALAAIGYYFEEDYENASKLALLAVENAPDDPNGYNCLIKAQVHLAPKDRAGFTIPDKLKDNVVIRLAEANQLEEEGRFDTAYAIYQKIDLDQLESPALKQDVMGFKGTALIQTLRFPELLLKGTEDGSKMAVIEEALGYLGTAIGYFAGTDLMPSRYYLYINAGVSKKLKGLHSEAMDDFKRAFDLNGSFTTFKYILVHSPFEKWAKLLEQAYHLDLSDEDEVTLTTIDAERLIAQSREEDALFILEKIRPMVERLQAKHQFYYLLLGDLYLNFSLADKLSVLLADLDSRREFSFSTAVIKARVAARAQDKTAYTEVGEKLLQEAEALDHTWARSIAFQAFRSLEDHYRAAEVLRPLCIRTSYTQFSRDFIESLYLDERFAEAATWINGYRGLGKEDEGVVDILSQMHEMVGNRELAISVLEEYHKKKPTIFLQAKLAFLYSVANKYEKARHLFESIGDLSILNDRTKKMLAIAHVLSGLPQTGLDLAYALRRNPENEQWYVEFIRYCCRGLHQYKAPSKVGINAYVGLRTDGADRRVIIVQDPKEDLEVSASEGFGANLLGCRISEKVMIDGTEWEVVEMDSKYGFAYRGGLKAFENSGKEIWKAVDADDLIAVGSFADKKQKTNKQIVEDYARGDYLEVIAKRHNIEMAGFWLEQLTTVQLRPLAMTKEEDEIEMNIQRPLLFDLLALITLHLSGEWDQVISSLPERPYVGRQVVRDLEALIHTLNVHRLWGEQVQVFPTTEGYQTIRIGRDQTEGNIARFEGLKAAIVEQFTILEVKLPENNRTFSQKKSEFGTGNAAVLQFLEEDETMSLVSEDPAFRKLVRKNRRAAALQHLVDRLRRLGLISGDAASRFFISLLNHGYNNVYLSLLEIQKAAEMDEGAIGGNVWLYIAWYLRQYPVPVRATNTAGIICQIFESTKHTDEQLIQMVNRVINFYLYAENSYEARTLLSNKIECIPGAPSKVRKAVLDHISIGQEPDTSC